MTWLADHTEGSLKLLWQHVLWMHKIYHVQCQSGVISWWILSDRIQDILPGGLYGLHFNQFVKKLEREPSRVLSMGKYCFSATVHTIFCYSIVSRFRLSLRSFNNKINLDLELFRKITASRTSWTYKFRPTLWDIETWSLAWQDQDPSAQQNLQTSILSTGPI